MIMMSKTIRHIWVNAPLVADEDVEVELVQISEYGTSDIRLASIRVPILDFLYPYRTIWPNYSSGLRELLLVDKSVAYPLSVSICMDVFGVLQLYHLLVAFVPFTSISLPMATLVTKLVQMVTILVH